MAARSNDQAPVSVSRRRVVGGAAIGLATAAAPTFAQGTTRAMADTPLTDPTANYPKPPFEKQSQPSPVLRAE